MAGEPADARRRPAAGGASDASVPLFRARIRRLLAAASRTRRRPVRSPPTRHLQLLLGPAGRRDRAPDRVITLVYSRAYAPRVLAPRSLAHTLRRLQPVAEPAVAHARPEPGLVRARR